MRVTVEEAHDPAVWELLDDAISQYNMQVTGYHTYTPVNILLRDDQGNIQGGALGGMWGEWFYLKYLWITEEERGKGYGRELLMLAEAEAIKGECRGMYLETYDFQAYSFYTRYGFASVGQLEDFPPGHTYYHLMKRFR